MKFLDNILTRLSRNRSPYRAIERRVLKYMKEYMDGRMSEDEFAENMESASNEIDSLMYDKEKNCYVFSQDTPQWLILFRGNKFVQWNRYRILYRQCRSNPDLDNDPRWPDIEENRRALDHELRNAIRYVLDNKNRP